MSSPATGAALVLNCDGLARNAALVNSLAADGVDVTFRSIDQLSFEAGPDGVCVRETVAGRDLADFGLVQVMAYQRPTSMLLNAVADYLAVRLIHAVSFTGLSVPTKLFKYVRLANRGVRVPSTIYLPPQTLAHSFGVLAERLDLPFVMKTVTGGGGRMTSLVNDETDLARRLRDDEHARLGFLAQELVPPDGCYSLMVLGGTVAYAARNAEPARYTVLQRPCWLAEEAIEPETVDPAAVAVSVRAAAALDYDVAGVRVVRHWTDSGWRVLDICPNPPIDTGRSRDVKADAYRAYLKRRLTSRR
jgi:hypothetical protein